MRVAPILLAAACAGKSDPPGTGPGTSPPVTTTATPYEHLPIRATFTWSDGTVDGKPIVYHVSTSDKPRALLFAFHGSHGNLGTVQQLEWLELYDRIVPEGIAVVLTQSLDRGPDEKWNTNDRSPSNPDFQAEVGVRQWLIDNTLVDEDTPIEAIGFSNGGGFVDLFAELSYNSGWDLRTYLEHNASSYGSNLPALFVSAENDETVSPDQVQAAADQCSAVTAAECPHLRGTEIPLDPRRFARMPEYSLDQSQAVFDDLVDLGFVDADGNRLLDDLSDPDKAMNYYIAHTAVKQPSPTLPPTQLRVVWATHRVTSQFVEDEAAWLFDHL